MSLDKKEYAEILELLKSIKGSPAMNGEFSELIIKVSEVRDIQTKIAGDLNVVRIKQEETHVKIREIQDALYNPDEGIYKRINDNKNLGEDIKENLDELKKQTSKIDEDILVHEKRLTDTELVANTLKEIGGGIGLQQLDGAIKLNKNTKKIFWAGIIALAGVVGKALWPLVKSVLF